MTVFTDPACYPAISLHQPYAGAIRLSGLGYPAKRIETRKTRIHYRGPLVICATAKSPLGWQQTTNKIYTALGCLDGTGAPFMLKACAVAIVNVVGCRPLVEEDYARSLWWDADEMKKQPRWAWILEDIVPLRPFPTKGSQGFFKVERKQVDLHARLGLADLFRQGGADMIEAGLAGSFAWPLLGEIGGHR